MNNPIRIGYSLSLSGSVAENTKAVMLAHRIWEEDINSKGGLLGRKIELVCYDDKGDPSEPISKILKGTIHISTALTK